MGSSLEIEVQKLVSDILEDYKGNQLLLFGSQWAVGWTQERNPKLSFHEFGGEAL